MRLYEFLADAASRPYRDLVQHHVRHQSKAQLLAASVAEVDLLPPELKPLAERFIDLVNERILRDQVFWQTVPCQGAVDAIISLANEHFGISLPVPADPKAMSGVEQELAFGIFQIATLTFAYNAVDQKALREFMGIRKGIFR
ncbi:MAG: hypothetical protein ACREQ7_25290 [Candidatus Binatia bacterium]